MQPPEASVSYPARPSFKANARAWFSSTIFLIGRLLSDWAVQLYISLKSLCEYKEELLQALSSVFPARSIPRRTGEVRLRATRKLQSQPQLPSTCTCWCGSGSAHVGGAFGTCFPTPADCFQAAQLLMGSPLLSNITTDKRSTHENVVWFFLHGSTSHGGPVCSALPSPACRAAFFAWEKINCQLFIFCFSK